MDQVLERNFDKIFTSWEGKALMGGRISFFIFIEMFNAISSDKILFEVTEDMVYEYCIDKLWKEKNGLEMIFGSS